MVPPPLFCRGARCGPPPLPCPGPGGGGSSPLQREAYTRDGDSFPGAHRGRLAADRRGLEGGDPLLLDREAGTNGPVAPPSSLGARFPPAPGRAPDDEDAHRGGGCVACRTARLPGKGGSRPPAAGEEIRLARGDRGGETCARRQRGEEDVPPFPPGHRREP